MLTPLSPCKYTKNVWRDNQSRPAIGFDWLCCAMETACSEFDLAVDVLGRDLWEGLASSPTLFTDVEGIEGCREFTHSGYTVYANVKHNCVIGVEQMK